MTDPASVNSKKYWDNRFSTGDWGAVGGNHQTAHFAQAQVRRLRLPRSFHGTLVDFGCGEGDALPIFKRAWPDARYIGIDFSTSAIERARARRGNDAEFMAGSHEVCPIADVIVASNIMEHLEDDVAVAGELQKKCRDLYIIVPFEEQYLIEEHVRRYSRNSFSVFNVLRIEVFACRGWSHYGFVRRIWHVHMKNVLRPLFGRVKLKPRLQVMYHIRGERQDG